MLAVFSDFHHSAFARSVFYAFADRLGHNLYFPSPCFAGKYAPDGVWGSMTDNFIRTMGGIDEQIWKKHVSSISYEKFMDSDFDIILMTRTESQSVLYPLLKKKGKKGQSIRIAWSGNENSQFDWSWIDNLIATDRATYDLVPEHVNKVRYIQEIGRHFGKSFVPISEEALTNIHTFINNLSGYDYYFHLHDATAYPTCPYCGLPKTPTRLPMNIYKLWQALQKSPHYKFKAFGHQNYQNVPDIDLPECYQDCGLTWHFKPSEGWGHSLLQSIASGRLVLVPKLLYTFKSASSYLIDGVTAIECKWNAVDVLEKIKDYTSNLDIANERAYNCWQVGQALLYPQLYIEELRLWLEDLF